ncbi:hypothetical protein [Streptacidiphilus sp. EB129]|uniref:hypothetical protein n=1 Tax=Streptacidiphilus sp. EB129 TaxID=3156262 RepID=UPI0035115F1F
MATGQGTAVGSELRAGLCDWLRSRRRELLPSAGDDAFRDGLAVLGLDDAGLDRFAAARRVVVTLPHASPNVFFPRAGVGWYARHLQTVDPDLFHLRVALTHVNFSDLGWRPYAWWYLDRDGALTRETLFTRNKKNKHVVVASLPPLETVPPSAHGADREAAELARHGADRAVSHLLLTATVERAAGLHGAGGTLYLPLDLLVEYVRGIAERPGASAHGPWAEALLASATQARRLEPDGRLAAADGRADAFVFDNPTNLALLAPLACTAVLGGAKMAGYWGEVEARVDAAASAARPGLPRLPQLVRMPEPDYRAVLAPSRSLADALASAGIEYSQGMAVAGHGRYADRIDPFADLPGTSGPPIGS